MRLPSFLVLLLSAAIATTALAQSSGAVRLSGFALENPETHSGPYQRAYGGELEFLSGNISTAVAVSEERTVITQLVSDPVMGNLPFTSFRTIYPIDALIRYHFANGSRVQPWLGAGSRYERVAGHDNWRTIADGGLTLALTKHFGIDFEAKRLYGQTKPAYGPNNSIKIRDGDFDEGRTRRLSAGLSLTF